MAEESKGWEHKSNCLTAPLEHYFKLILLRIHNRDSPGRGGLSNTRTWTSGFPGGGGSSNIEQEQSAGWSLF